MGESASEEFFEAPNEERIRVLRSELAMNPGCFTMGAFGVVDASKGFQILIQALAVLNELGVPARLLLTGGRSGVLDTICSVARRSPEGWASNGRFCSPDSGTTYSI